MVFHTQPVLPSNNCLQRLMAGVAGTRDDVTLLMWRGGGLSWYAHSKYNKGKIMTRATWMFGVLSGLFAASAFAAPTQFLSATVKDKVVDGAEVTFQRIGSPSVIARTDSQGRLTLDAMPFGGVDDPSVVMIARKEGYSPLVVKCPCSGYTYALSEKLSGLDSIRIVLSWGSHPFDLDAHLVYPDNHIYFRVREGSGANLDVDDTYSYGPETITITERPDGGRYAYAVYNFTNRKEPHSRAIAESPARVDVYVGQTLVRTYVPAQRQGTVWVPFLIDHHGEFHDVDMYLSRSSPEDIRTALASLVEADSWSRVVETLSPARPVPAYRPATAAAPAPAAVTTTDAVTKNRAGEQAYHRGEFDAAIALYREAIDIDPQYGQAYSNLGLAYQKAGRIPEAMWANRKAIALAEGANKAVVQASSYYNLGRIYESQSRWDRALQNYQYALNLRQHRAYTEGIARMKEKVGQAVQN